MNKLSFTLVYFVILMLHPIRVWSVGDDTLYLTKGLHIIDTSLSYSFYSDLNDYNNVQLISDDRGFGLGYLFIKFELDSNVCIKKIPGSNPQSKLSTLLSSVYFIKSEKWESQRKPMVDSALEKIECDTCKLHYLYNSHDLMRDGNIFFLNGKRDNLSIFLYHYNLFDKNNYFYLSKSITNVLISDTLANKIVWQKNNDKIGYIIFEVVFDAAILKYKNQNEKFILPVSIFRYFNEAESTLLISHGFKKSLKTLIVK